MVTNDHSCAPETHSMSSTSVVFAIPAALVVAMLRQEPAVLASVAAAAAAAEMSLPVSTIAGECFVSPGLAKAAKLKGICEDCNAVIAPLDNDDD